MTVWLTSRGRLQTGPAELSAGLRYTTHQARSGVGPKKNRRDQLLQRARGHPPWALGCGDAVWWRRLAQPHQQGGTEPEATEKLPELTRPTADPDPKALAG
jgi:hypothetical protein